MDTLRALRFGCQVGRLCKRASQARHGTSIPLGMSARCRATVAPYTDARTRRVNEAPTDHICGVLGSFWCVAARPAQPKAVGKAAVTAHSSMRVRATSCIAIARTGVVMPHSISHKLACLLALSTTLSGAISPVEARATRVPDKSAQHSTALAAPIQSPSAMPVATVEGQSVSLAELDTKGGREVYDAVEQLYQARVRALYQWLTDDLLAREAKAQHLSVEQLLESHVNALVPVASDAEVDAFLKARTGSSQIDPPRRREAAWYLTLKHRAEKKRDYVQTLFTTYAVKVTLESPPAPPAEEIRGASDPMVGESSAPVTVVVFSDYLCPYCKTLAGTLHDLLKHYPKEVRVIYRQFPIHTGADQLAEASLCAADQERFEAYHELLFASPAPSPAGLDELAQKAGLDTATFSTCLKTGIHKARIAEDMQEGRRLDIQGTPTLFVDGLRLRGTPTLGQLSARVDEALRTQHSRVAANGAGAH
jgi:protein-disulfide isomerase